MKKIITLLLCLLMLTGCDLFGKKEPVITYDYDYIDYLDIEFIGPDGYATMDINLSDFSAADFKSEEDFIKMKRIMNSLIDDVAATKMDTICNGDVIQVGVNSTFDPTEAGDVSINLGVHQMTVSGLPPAKQLDLYDPSNVVFYGLEGTSKVYFYFPVNSDIPKEAREHLDYVITLDDEEVHKNKSILSLEAVLDEELLNSKRQYGTLTRYFGNNGCIIEESAERSLKATVNEQALEKVEKTKLRGILEKEIKLSGGVDGYDLVQIMSIQKADELFKYYIVAMFRNDTKDIYVKFSTSMAYVNNEVMIYALDKESITDVNYCTKPFADATNMYTFEIFEIPEEETLPENEIVGDFLEEANKVETDKAE